MAPQFDASSAGPKRKSRTFVKLETYSDWIPEKGNIDVTDREVQIGMAVSRYEDSQTDPITDLKERLSLWGMHSHISYDSC